VSDFAEYNQCQTVLRELHGKMARKTTGGKEGSEATPGKAAAAGRGRGFNAASPGPAPTSHSGRSEAEGDGGGGGEGSDGHERDAGEGAEGESPGGVIEEFAAYRLLYAAAQDTTEPLSQELRRLPTELGLAALTHPLVTHAMDVVEAKAAGNFHKFFKLYAVAPRMASYLMELMLPGVRRVGLRAVLRAHSPTVDAEWVADVLGFAVDAAGADSPGYKGAGKLSDRKSDGGGGGVSGGDEFKAYLAEEGCVLVEALAGAGCTPQLLIDTKLSMAADAGPERPPALPPVRSAPQGPATAAAANFSPCSKTLKKKKKRSRGA
jgi:hypothetical protein